MRLDRIANLKSRAESLAAAERWEDAIAVYEEIIEIEPGLDFAPGRGMVHEENIVVREHGAEYLSRRAPAELPELT